MGPQPAVARRVGIPFLVGVLMVNAVRCYPSDRSTFKSKRAAHGQEVLDPFRSLIAAVRKKPVVADPDAEATGDKPQNNCQCESFPCKKEQRREGTDVEYGHKKRRNPIDWLGKRSVAFEDARHFRNP